MKLSALCALVFAVSLAATEATKRNVLFIMVDDFRPEIQNYSGDSSFRLSDLQTPTLSALAKESMVLSNAYATQALCCPSRTSIMTGRFPASCDMTMCGYWRDYKNYTSLPQHFKEQDYTTYGMGKIYHPGEGNDDIPYSWTGGASGYFNPVNNHRSSKSWKSIAVKSQDNEDLPDQLIKAKAVDKIGELAKDYKDNGKNFFLAVGFLKPHLPFVYPHKYHDDTCTQTINKPANAYFPTDAPTVAWSGYGELRKYNDIPSSDTYNAPLEYSKTQELRCAYRACVHYIDAMIGEVLKALKDNGVHDSTVVAVQSDHGYQLGEHNEWSKMTNFELALRIPFILKVPGVTENLPNHVFDDLSEGTDTFPTLVAAAGIEEVPPCAGQCLDKCHEGRNLLELINGASDWRKAAHSWYPRDGRMGLSVRTATMRCTAWPKFTKKTMTVDTDNMEDSYIECYDHTTDPEENTNIFKGQLLSDDEKTEIRDYFKDISPWGNNCKSVSTRGNSSPSLHSGVDNSLLKELKQYLKSLM